MKTVLAAAAAILIASTAAGSAADMPMKAAPIMPSPVWSWTGFYVSGFVGAGWGTTESTLTGASAPGLGAVAFTLPFSQDSRSGFLGGGGVGYNFQSGWAVFGIEGDIAGLDVKGTTTCLVVLSCSTKSNWLATVSGRIGGVVGDRALIYAKGGGAWLNSTHTAALPVILGGGIGITTSADSTTQGWLLGLGVEYAFSPNWSAFIEYDYMDFQKKNVGFPLALGGLTATVNADILNKLSVMKIGASYKF